MMSHKLQLARRNVYQLIRSMNASGVLKNDEARCVAGGPTQVSNIVTNVVKMTEKNELIDAALKKLKVKRPPVPKITLLGSNNKVMSVVTLEEAQRMAQSKGLKLIKIVDLELSTQRPVYRLMTKSQYLEEDYNEKKSLKMKEKHVVKGEKLIMISTRVSEHDLHSKIKQMKKQLAKKFEVRVIISYADDNKALAEKIFGIMEEELKNDGRVVQKRYKENDLRFSLLPPKENVIVGLDTNKKSDIASDVQAAYNEADNDDTKEHLATAGVTSADHLEVQPDEADDVEYKKRSSVTEGSTSTGHVDIETQTAGERKA